MVYFDHPHLTPIPDLDMGAILSTGFCRGTLRGILWGLGTAGMVSSRGGTLQGPSSGESQLCLGNPCLACSPFCSQSFIRDDYRLMRGTIGIIIIVPPISP